jgi:hypothetical protein
LAGDSTITRDFLPFFLAIYSLDVSRTPEKLRPRPCYRPSGGNPSRRSGLSCPCPRAKRAGSVVTVGDPVKATEFGGHLVVRSPFRSVQAELCTCGSATYGQANVPIPPRLSRLRHPMQHRDRAPQRNPLISLDLQRAAPPFFSKTLHFVAIGCTRRSAPAELRRLPYINRTINGNVCSASLQRRAGARVEKGQKRSRRSSARSAWSIF